MPGTQSFKTLLDLLAIDNDMEKKDKESLWINRSPD
jgi:hypothetical protein